MYFGNSAFDSTLSPLAVSRLPGLLGRGHVDLVARIVHRRPVAVHVDGVAADHGRGLHLKGEAAHPPQFASGGGIVGRQQKRAGNDDLIAAVGVAPDDRRRVAAPGLGPLGSPPDPAVPFVDGHDEGPDAVVADQDDEIADDDRRGAHAIDVGERAQRHRPALPAGAVVGDEPVVGEEDVDPVRFDGRARRRGVVALVDDPDLCRGRGTIPHHASRGPVDRQGDQTAAAKAGEIDPVVEQHRRRMPLRHWQPPHQVARRTELGRNACGGRHPGAVRSAET